MCIRDRVSTQSTWENFIWKYYYKLNYNFNMDANKKQDRRFRKYTFRGLDIDALTALTNEQFVEKLRARQRRRFSRGLKHKYTRLLMKIRKAKKNLQPGEKPAPVKTHLRNAIIMPEMIGSVIAIHNGREFSPIEIKFDMMGKYLGEFAISYKPTAHGRPGVGSSKGTQHQG
eukprot:TRINITY_DN230_c0_g1_i10.p1 TRINITY_DN230_c0_g1~~TRINITY_DN230_c0_g1_i10.p1  ORF type:complete len:172 (-),score=80.46 TRINITY_DN230_c0_g1_i10:179-694(-)